MYTKCPSCRAELSFLPPANPESLPEGYKHRVKCPHCGVTIGVKIDKPEYSSEYQQMQSPANTQQSSSYSGQYLTYCDCDLDENEFKRKSGGIKGGFTAFWKKLTKRK